MKVIPIGLAVAAVLVGFARKMGTPMVFGDLFNPVEGTAVEVPRDLGPGRECEQQKADGEAHISLDIELTRENMHREEKGNNPVRIYNPKPGGWKRRSSAAGPISLCRATAPLFAQR